MKRLLQAVGVTGALLVALLPTTAEGQSTGRITGRVVDATSAKPLSGAQVYVNDGVVGALSNLDGRYMISRVPQGTLSVTVQRLGYATKTVTGVTVGTSIVVLDLTVEERAVQLEGIFVEAARDRGAQAYLLDERRVSQSMVEAVGAADIARRPDSDAADVARRLTGVTVAEGKYVFVRGLGGRYSQTSLNGSSLPSPEPEREVVPLDLFPADFLESIQTQKSYTPDLPADFSGGAIQLETKDFPNETAVRFSVGTSVNTNSQFKDGFLAYAGGGRDWLGFDDGTRGLPQAVLGIMGDVHSGERLPSDQGQLIQIGQAFQNLGQNFAPAGRGTPLNRTLNVSIGGRGDVLDDGEIGYILAANYGDNYTLRTNEVERKWRVSAFDPAVPADLRAPNVDYSFTRGTRNINWGTIGNLTFKPNPNQKLSLRTTVSMSTDDEARSYIGDNREDIGGTVRSDRLRFVSRLMLWSQLSGEHRLFGDSRLEWRATTARATRDEPLLRESVYVEDHGEFFLHPIGESGRYFWSDMSDNDRSFAADWSVPFGFIGQEATVKVGGEARSRSRDFAARRLNWDFVGGTITDIDSALAAASIVGNARNRGEFAIADVVEPGDLYDASDRRSAGYALVDLPIGNRLKVNFGARVEDYEVGLFSRGDTLKQVGAIDVAPSVNLIFRAADRVTLRAAASRTVDRPEFREMAPFQFTEATSLRQLYGNPSLTPAQINSMDLRAEWFAGPGEIISVGTFYKKMLDPIEQVFIAASSTAFSFQNAKEATVRGLELEAQLNLSRLTESLQDFSVQANYALIHSDVEVREGEGGFNPTNLMRPLEGQAPYVLNGGINYSGFSGLQFGLFVNRFGDRLNAAGGGGIPDLYEKARTQFDATLAFPVRGGATAKIKATNLLDAEYAFEQEANGITQVQRLYTTGRTISVGISWELR
ncbi:MAG: TonB-dependent receptor [Gemmatimonadetes bacterium]|jgi:hypothetical protein|nr:TonB-dependent receptor [Gemmatimonadota bacterium]